MIMFHHGCVHDVRLHVLHLLIHGLHLLTIHYTAEFGCNLATHVWQVLASYVGLMHAYVVQPFLAASLIL